MASCRLRQLLRICRAFTDPCLPGATARRGRPQARTATAHQTCWPGRSCWPCNAGRPAMEAPAFFGVMTAMTAMTVMADALRAGTVPGWSADCSSQIGRKPRTHIAQDARIQIRNGPSPDRQYPACAGSFQNPSKYPRALRSLLKQIWGQNDV